MQSWTWEKHATVAKDHDEWTGRVRDWIKTVQGYLKVRTQH